MKEFFKDIGNINLLTQEEEIALAKRIKKGGADGKAALDKMVVSNLRLVISIANDYAKNGEKYCISLSDLIQEGSIGLMHAAEKFEWNKGFKFSTYASWWIRQSITRFLEDKGNVIRLPVHRQQQINNYKQVHALLEQKLGRIPSDGEMSASMGISEEQVKKIRNAGLKMLYLEDSAGSSDMENTIGDFVSETKYENAENITCNKLINRQLQEDMNNFLTKKEQQVIRLRFGFEDGSMQTLEEVGHLFGVTRERVRQIESKAILKLRAVYKKRGIEFADCIAEGA